MLKWIALFSVITVLASLTGFTTLADGALAIAKSLLYVFMGLVVASIILGETLLKKK